MACEACCKAEIKVLKKQGLLCTKVDRDALCRHKTVLKADDEAGAVAPTPAPPQTTKKKLNIIHLNTDDQANLLGDMRAMPFFMENVAKHGVTLQNYYTNTPICCPSRATTLSGTISASTNYGDRVSGTS